MIKETELITFINKCNSNLHLVKHDGNYYHTTKDMFNLGIKTCNLCGKFMPIEKRFCTCGEETFVFFELPKNEQLKIDKAIKKTTTSAKVKDSHFYYKFTGINLETLKTEDITKLLTFHQSVIWYNGSGKEKALKKYANIQRVRLGKKPWKI